MRETYFILFVLFCPCVAQVFVPGWSLSAAPQAVKIRRERAVIQELELHQRSLHHWGMLSCSAKYSASDVLSGDPFKWIANFTPVSSLKGSLHEK